MSSASFRLTLVSSRIAYISAVGIVLMVTAASFPYLWERDVIAVVLLLNMFWVWWVGYTCCLRLRLCNGEIWLNFYGDLRLDLELVNVRAILTEGCLIADWGCRLVYQRIEKKEHNKSIRESFWIPRDSMNEADYRRLCRVLHYHRQHNTRQTDSMR